jgi:hypothetical protein
MSPALLEVKEWSNLRRGHGTAQASIDLLLELARTRAVPVANLLLPTLPGHGLGLGLRRMKGQGFFMLT